MCRHVAATGCRRLAIRTGSRKNPTPTSPQTLDPRLGSNYNGPFTALWGSGSRRMRSQIAQGGRIKRCCRFVWCASDLENLCPESANAEC